MNFVMWLIVGSVAGWMVSSFMSMPESLPLNVLVGIIGALIVGLVATSLSGGISIINPSNLNLSTILVSWVGAIILLVVLNFFRSRMGLLR